MKRLWLLLLCFIAGVLFMVSFLAARAADYRLQNIGGMTITLGSQQDTDITQYDVPLSEARVIVYAETDPCGKKDYGFQGDLVYHSDGWNGTCVPTYGPVGFADRAAAAEWLTKKGLSEDKVLGVWEVKPITLKHTAKEVERFEEVRHTETRHTWTP